jgi:hypothetical protein
MQIDAVEQRPADLSQITLDNAAGAAALASGIGKMPAGAPVQITTPLNMKVGGTLATARFGQGIAASRGA